LLCQPIRVTQRSRVTGWAVRGRKLPGRLARDDGLSLYAPRSRGPILIAGAPLSYWAGVRGKNPMRYLGGMLGGSWLARLASDLGNSIFDGAWLIANFDAGKPSNTLWGKQYNVWADPRDAEAQPKALAANSVDPR
jgi:hypothetical protein